MKHGITLALNLTVLCRMCVENLARFQVAESLSLSRMDILTFIVFLFSVNIRFLCSGILKGSLGFVKKMLSLRAGTATLTLRV